MTIIELIPLPAAAAPATPPDFSPKAKTIFALGVMGYAKYDRLAHGAMYAMFAFDNLLALAKKRGFQRPAQIKGAVRRGKATPFAMEKAEAMAALVADDEFARELATLRWYDRNSGGRG